MAKWTWIAAVVILASSVAFAYYLGLIYYTDDDQKAVPFAIFVVAFSGLMCVVESSATLVILGFRRYFGNLFLPS